MKNMNDPFPHTPETFRLRMERTLNGLEEKEMTRRTFSLSMAVILAVLLLITTAFAAAGYLSGSVDWNGKYTPDKVQNAPLPTTEPDYDAMVQSPAELARENMPEGEVWTILESWGMSSSAPRSYSLTDLDRFEKYLYGTKMPMAVIPENMTLSYAGIETPSEALPYEEVFYGDEILQKYKMQPLFAGTAISYRMDFRDANDGHVYISCYKEELSYENMSFGVDEGDVYEILKNTGWNHGIYICQADGDQSIHLQFVLGDCVIAFSIQTRGTALTKDDLLALIPTFS